MVNLIKVWVRIELHMITVLIATDQATISTYLPSSKWRTRVKWSRLRTITLQGSSNHSSIFLQIFRSTRASTIQELLLSQDLVTDIRWWCCRQWTRVRGSTGTITSSLLIKEQGIWKIFVHSSVKGGLWVMTLRFELLQLGRSTTTTDKVYLLRKKMPKAWFRTLGVGITPKTSTHLMLTKSLRTKVRALKVFRSTLMEPQWVLQKWLPM